jgi:exodeoxyribonuclease V gamma subunit
LARALRTRAADPVAAEAANVFFESPLSAPSPLPAELPVATLAAFYRGPAKVLLEQTLGLRVERGEADLPTVEPLSTEYESERRIERQLLDAALAGRNAAELRAFALALPDLPAGRLGEVASHQVITETLAFAERIRLAQHEPLLQPQRLHAPVRVDEATVTLTADASALRPSGLLHVSHWRYSAASIIETWVQHLLLNLARPVGVEPVSRHLFKDDLYTFAPVADPEVHLAALLRHYRVGLTEPLHFYPKTSMARAEGENVTTTWEGSDYGPVGESTETLMALAVRGQDEPLDTHFEALSDELLAPLVAHLTQGVPLP